MSRSVWKFPLIYETKYSSSSNRSVVICEKHLRTNVEVHLGHSRRRVFIDRKKLGFKFGEFCFTRKYTKRVVIKKKKLKRK